MRLHERPDRPACSLKGCERLTYVRELCCMHYNRLRVHGDVGPVEPKRRGWGEGTVIADGYVVLHDSRHPLAGSQGKVRRNRVVLYAAIGPGEHPCHWCGVVLPWQGRPSKRINADHLDGNRLNDTPENLVPSCMACNTQRARRLVVTA